MNTQKTMKRNRKLSKPSVTILSKLETARGITVTTTALRSSEGKKTNWIPFTMEEEKSWEDNMTSNFPTELEKEEGNRSARGDRDR